MTLKYDFDFFSIIPDAVVQGEHKNILSEIGFDAGASQNKKPVLRYPETLTALMRAPDEVKSYLANLGFGGTIYDSGAPAGTYLPSDEAHRKEIMGKLFVQQALPNVKAMMSANVPDGEFSLSDFWEYNIAATPVGSIEKPQKSTGRLVEFLDRFGIELTGTPAQQRRTAFNYASMALVFVLMAIWWVGRSLAS